MLQNNTWRHPNNSNNKSNRMMLWMHLLLLVFCGRPASAFVVPRQSSHSSRTRLWYREQSASVENTASDTTTARTTTVETDLSVLDIRRQVLKERLVSVAFEYDPEQIIMSPSVVTAEDVMKELEKDGLCPYDRPVEQLDLLHSRWAFVFTGVPTIGMQLITLLSRLASYVRLVEFGTVYLEVVNSNMDSRGTTRTFPDGAAVQSAESNNDELSSRVDAIVEFRVATIPMELVVQTTLECNTTFPFNDGTHLIETFKCIRLNGIPVPTPKSWHSSRDLNVNYLDEDMMIARTAGGEPHLLLRQNKCSIYHEECSVDADLTHVYAMAQNKYGNDRLTRSLVDRDYAAHKEDDPTSIFKLLRSIFTNPGKH